MTRVQPFMVRAVSEAQHHVTEPYVSVPPALTITDETGAIWTLGFRDGGIRRGEFAFNVLRDGVNTGDVATRLERHKGRVRAYTPEGWTWMTSRAEPTRVLGIAARLPRLAPDDVPRTDDPIRVVIRRTGAFDPLVTFAFKASDHGAGIGVNLECPSGQWLFATTEPVVDVEVMAALGQNTSRAIPVNRSLMEV